jgi:hypothetical protein
MLRLLRLLVAALLLGGIAACGGSGSTQVVQTEHYKVQLTLDALRFGERTATIEVSDLSGAPVAADTVVVAPVMTAMGMASPDVTAQALGGGRYEARGVLFSMVGDWEFDVRVSKGGSVEVARFTVKVAE